MERQFMKGCEAIAEAAVRAGCRFFAGYPITPQNEIPEYFARRMPEVGGEFIQGESEIAAVNMLFGAGIAGKRAMTSSSSCGIALKSEGISYMAQGMLPTVIVSVMRGGPGVGSIKPAQQDYFQATKASGNGGFRMLVYAPDTVQEAVDTMRMAFEKAEQYRNPVVVLIDGFTAVMMEPVALPDLVPEDELAVIEQHNYDWDISLNFKPGDKRSIGLTWKVPLRKQNQDAADMYESWGKAEVKWEEYRTDDAEFIITAYGISARIARSAIDGLRGEGLAIGLIRPITLFPFPTAAFEALDYDRIHGILSAEMSIPAQFAEDVDAAIRRRTPVDRVLSSAGDILSRDEIMAAARAMADRTRR